MVLKYSSFYDRQRKTNMKKFLTCGTLLFLGSCSVLWAQENKPDTLSRVVTGEDMIPLVEEPPTQNSAPTNVRLSTPLINVDLIFDLYNKDIDFIIDYAGQASGSVSGYKPKKPSEKEVAEIVDSSKAKKEQPQTGSYSKEDASYNRAMTDLHTSQKLFSDRLYEEALRAIDKSINGAPNIALAHSVRGSILFMLRQIPEARKSWERALELDPTMDNVRAILYRLYQNNQ
jgi:tetratricopeptide (TPR) repeat protein